MNASHGSAVHRGLHLVSPLAHGADVRALQERVNDELAHRRLSWRQVAVDGQFGPRTLHACAFLGWVLGLSGRRLAETSGSKPRLSRWAQRVLRNPRKRSPADRSRERLRRRKVQALRQAHADGPGAAVDYIREMAADGVHEVGSSNTGKLVDRWQSYFGLHAQPWCGCFAGYAAKAVGGSQATTWFPYGPSIIADARAGRNGVREVAFEEAEPGDVLVFWGGEHIGTAMARPSGGSIATGEGNTAPNNGDSQADGGAVALKTRSRSDVTCVARVY
ncbi:MAG TPA: hypothetical protein VGV69_05970 [Solirubrobacterales bacterium]|nr:hypothetical protein [Solirubrobacterales bacterium]